MPSHDFPTDGNGNVVGVVRRRAADVGEPVDSALTFEALVRLAQTIAGRARTEAVCRTCGERVSDDHVKECLECFKKRRRAEADARQAKRDARAIARRKYLQKRERYKRLGLNANGKPYRLRQRYALAGAIA